MKAWEYEIVLQKHDLTDPRWFALKSGLESDQIPYPSLPDPTPLDLWAEQSQEALLGLLDQLGSQGWEFAAYTGGEDIPFPGSDNPTFRSRHFLLTRPVEVEDSPQAI